jgi:hypothetical protein
LNASPEANGRALPDEALERRITVNRPLALLAALVLTAISVSSACMAAPESPMSFTLQDKPGRGRIQLTLIGNGRHEGGTMSNSFAETELSGLDIASLRQPGQRPVRFAFVRDPGRIDCNGYGGNSVATGQCTFSANPAFAGFLAARGIGRPSFKQAYDLTITGATRDLVDALATYHYPRPDIDKLAELAAVGVRRSYIASLAARGQAPTSLDDLTQFAALGVTPDFIDGLARAGYRGLSADEIAQLKAVGVTPTLIASLAAAGYPNLSADDLEQFAALGVTPEFISGFARIGYSKLPVDTLVQLKALDVTPEYVRSLQAHGLYPRSADQLVKLKAAGLGDRD